MGGGGRGVLIYVLMSDFQNEAKMSEGVLIYVLMSDFQNEEEMREGVLIYVLMSDFQNEAEMREGVLVYVLMSDFQNLRAYFGLDLRLRKRTLGPVVFSTVVYCGRRN